MSRGGIYATSPALSIEIYYFTLVYVEGSCFISHILKQFEPVNQQNTFSLLFQWSLRSRTPWFLGMYLNYYHIYIYIYIYIYMFGDKSLHLMQTDDNMIIWDNRLKAFTKA